MYIQYITYIKNDRAVSARVIRTLTKNHARKIDIICDFLCNDLNIFSFYDLYYIHILRSIIC